MKPGESGWSQITRAVLDALDLPPEARAACLAARCPDPARRAEAQRLLVACERAARSPVLDSPASQFAAPLLTEVAAESLRVALAERYAIERELGRGGQATVYLARDERHGRLVALKVLQPALLSQDEPSSGAARFQREIAFAARLSHPHILPLYDSGAAAGRLYYVTPYVDGESLRDRLARVGRLPLDQTVRLLRDVARALAHAHRQGVVHRDIKPANILLNQDGDALVSDFGVAEALEQWAGAEGSDLTDAALILGTPAYMAPEQAGGGPAVDHRADLYAFGVVAYELLTGATPFAGRDRNEMLAAHVSQVPVPVTARPPAVPAALATLVNRLIAKRPADRPRDAAEILEVLDTAVAGGEPAGVAPVRGTENPEAYELYEKGRYLYNTRQRDGLLRALQYFEHAVALDSAYARAYAGIADAYTLLGAFGHVPPGEAHAKGRAAAERALDLDSQLAEGHAAVAHQLLVFDWNWKAAGPAFERAIALDPRYPVVRMYYASYLHAIGQPKESLAQLRTAQELDPLTPTGMLSARVYVDTHRPDVAIRILEELIELDPRRDLAYQLLGHAYLQQGRDRDAIAAMSRAAALSGPRDSAQLAYIHAATGNRPEAHRILDQLRQDETILAPLGFHIAMAYSGLGEADEAFRWLERSYEQRGSFMNLLGVASGFESIRSDPRFADLLRRMGLPLTHDADQRLTSRA